MASTPTFGDAFPDGLFVLGVLPRLSDRDYVSCSAVSSRWRACCVGLARWSQLRARVMHEWLSWRQPLEQHTIVLCLNAFRFHAGMAGQEVPLMADYSCYLDDEHLGRRVFSYEAVEREDARWPFEQLYQSELEGKHCFKFYRSTLGQLDISGIKSFLQHVQKYLNRKFAEHSVVLVVPADMTNGHKVAIAGLLFEDAEFSVPSLCVVPDPCVAIFCGGTTTAVAVHVGWTSTRVTGVYEGCLVDDTCTVIPTGGLHVTSALRDELSQVGFRFSHTFPHVEQSVRAFVDQCRVSLNLEEELEGVAPVDVQLADGSSVKVPGKCMIAAPEVLFAEGRLIEAIVKVATRNGIDGEFSVAPIVLYGSPTLLDGFRERVEAELSKLVANPARIICPPERRYMSFIGGSIFASLSTLDPHLVRSCEGKEAVPKKCLF